MYLIYVSIVFLTMLCNWWLIIIVNTYSHSCCIFSHIMYACTVSVTVSFSVCVHILYLCVSDLSLSLLAQVDLLSVPRRRGAGQHLGDRAGVFRGGAVLRGHQGGVQTSTKLRGRASICLLQAPDRRAVSHHTLNPV